MTESHSTFKKVMDEYKVGLFTNAMLAKRNGVSLATISNWIKTAGLPPKRRGRRRLKEPNDFHQRVFELAKNMTSKEITSKLGISRQRLHQIFKRWGHPMPEAKRIAQMRTADSPRAQYRELRDTIVSFRLTARQIEFVNGLVSTIGIRGRISDDQACRFILLSALGHFPLFLCLNNPQLEDAFNRFQESNDLKYKS